MRPFLLPLAVSILLVTGCGERQEAAPGQVSQEPTVPPRVDRPDVVLITLDTTRADHLGAWGWPHARTPNLDALAARGTRFERCDTASPVTLPSHATLLTGLFPPRHGVRDNGTFELGTDEPTLGELFTRAGYSTAAVVSAAVLARQYGLDRGFATYDDDLGAVGEAFAETAERSATDTTDVALRLLGDAPSPRLLWVHYFDPHERYAAPPEFQRLATGPTADYDAEIAYLDDEIGRLLTALSPETVVAVVGDHGEMLGDHGEATHGLLLRAGSRRVPLMFAGPGVPVGQTVSCLSRTADVPVTLLDLAGIPVPAGLDGGSLTPYFGADAPSCSALSYSESYLPLFSYRWHPLRAVSDGDTLYVRAREGRLYDLRDDPTESRDLATSAPDAAARWELRMVETLADLGETLDQVASPNAELSAQDRARLESLGYLAGAGGAASEDLASLPDPATKTEIASALHASARAAQDGDCRSALPRLVELLRKEPDLLPALNLSGLCLLEAGRTEQALAAFERASRINPDDSVPVANAGHALLRLGRRDAAIERYRLAMELDPAAAGAAPNLVALLRESGQGAEAAEILERAFAAGSHHPGLYLEHGMLAAGAGDYPSAFESFREAARRDRSNPVPLANAARAAVLLERWPEAVDLYRALLERVPESAETWATLGGLYADRLGDRERALECFERARIESRDAALNARLDAVLDRLRASPTAPR